MVLQGLADRLTQAFSNLRKNLTIDNESLELMLEEIGNALEGADVPLHLINRLKTNLRKQLLSEDFQKYAYKQSIIRHWVYLELVNLLNPGVEPFVPKKGDCNVMMFVGLQGSGKTTTIAKFAHYYKKRKWKCALVCADTFRAGAFDQLKQNATKIGVPFYGSHTEMDPVKLSSDGVELFRKEKYELILVDTSGRHKQEENLFKEMKQIEENIKPNDIVFIMDGTIGQAAFDQAKAFKSTVNIGSCIITKLDGSSKGGGALAAVAATKSPITFTGYGEHFNEFENFDPKGYASRLLGYGDPRALINKIPELDLDPKKQKAMLKRMMEGTFTLRDLHEQLNAIMKMGMPISEMMGLISPQLSKVLKDQNVPLDVLFKKFLTIMDSMTNDELDTPNFSQFSTSKTRIDRLALGSGCSRKEVTQLFTQYKEFKKVFETLRKKMNFKDMMKYQNDPQKMMEFMNQLVPGGMKNATKQSQMMQQLQRMGRIPKGMRIKKR